MCGHSLVDKHLDSSVAQVVGDAPRGIAVGANNHRVGRRDAPLRGSKRLHQLSKRGAKSRESRGLAGVHIMSEFANNNEDLRRKASADKGLRNPRYYRFQQ